MAQRATVDAADIPELRRIVDEMQDSQEPVVIQDKGEDVAIVLPLTRGERGHRIAFKPTREQIEAAMSAAGGWKGLIDPDELKAQIKAARGSNRPAHKV